MKFLKTAGLITAILLTQGCASPVKHRAAMDQLIISEPVTINYKSELALARMTEIIHRAEITNAQRAQLFYDRGVIYDSVGLRSLARFDFNRALKLKPDLVDAYNFLGIHYTQLQEFSQAYEAFDSALELSPEHEFAYLNRGIALYYGARHKLAASDFDQFYQHQTNDPYRLLWLFLAEREINEVNAITNLKRRSANIADNVWAKEIIYLFSGEIDQARFISRLAESVASERALTERLCEAYFYLGKYNQYQGNINTAKNFYKLALSTNVYEFVEHRYARLELDLLAQEPKHLQVR